MSGADVLVLGAGVIGLTTAITLAEAGHRTTILADEIPGRTSLAAGASWGPYLVEPRNKVNTWSLHTLRVLTDLAAIPGTGVRTISGIEASRTAGEAPAWTSQLPEVHVSPSHELPHGFRTGWRYTVPVMDMPRYLGHLLGRLRSAGTMIERRHITDVYDLTAAAPIVINCTGLGARKVAADDSIYPVRGQLVVLANPGLDTFFSEDTGPSPQLTHYLPHGDTVVVGGTATRHDCSREPDLATAEAIIARCSDIEPRLRTAQILGHRVGLRPTRPQIRLEAQTVKGNLLIHNYGHGGAGVSVSWGCAAEVLEHVESA